jgi:hypothetical protein
VIAVPAVLIDHENNFINLRYLDRKRPDVYVVRNPEAILDFGKPIERGQNSTIGPDLQSLIKDPEFSQVLRTQRFYKQNFDEPFQVLDKAVIFGYRVDAESKREPPCLPRSGFLKTWQKPFGFT